MARAGLLRVSGFLGVLPALWWRRSARLFVVLVVSRWPPAQLPGLHADLRSRPPTAGYRCGRCDWMTSAVGEQIPGITVRIEEHRRAGCPPAREGEQ